MSMPTMKFYQMCVQKTTSFFVLTSLVRASVLIRGTREYEIQPEPESFVLSSANSCSLVWSTVSQVYLGKKPTSYIIDLIDENFWATT